MPRPNRITSRLRTAQRERRSAVLAGVVTAARAVDRALGSLWAELLRVLKITRGFADDYARTLAVLRRVGPVTFETLTRRLAGLYYRGHADAAAAVLTSVPPEALRRAARLAEGTAPGLVALTPAAPAFVRHEISGRGEVLVMVDPARLDAAWARGHPDYYLPAHTPGKSEVKGRREGFKDFLAKGKPIQASRVTYDPDTGEVDFIDGRHRFAVLRDLGLRAVGVMVPRKQADTFRDLFGVPPEPEPEPDTPGDLRDLLFPPPAEADVSAWLAHLVRPADFERVGTDTDRRLPEELARDAALAVSQGKSQREIALVLRPHLDGSRVRATRAARTLGLVAAHAGQRQAWAGLGGMLVGYTLEKTTVPDSRPWHVARVGRQYFFDPGPGQDGMHRCPHPPEEPADPGERPAGAPHIAWNCL